jgi:hypothetical protein
VSRSSGVQRAEGYLVQVFLVGAVITSVILNIVGVDPKWYLPGVFMALYGIYKKLDDIQPPADLMTSSYTSSGEYYTALQGKVQQASESVWMTYMRAAPPPGYGLPEADAYFRFTVDWARAHPGREFRRIFAASDDGPMAEWLLAHHAEHGSLANYQPRVLATVSKVDMMSVGIFDAREVILVLTGDGNSLTGHTLANAHTVRTFREWYVALWNAADPLDDFVERVQRKRAPAPHARTDSELH